MSLAISKSVFFKGVCSKVHFSKDPIVPQFQECKKTPVWVVGFLSLVHIVTWHILVVQKGEIHLKIVNSVLTPWELHLIGLRMLHLSGHTSAQRFFICWSDWYKEYSFCEPEKGEIVVWLRGHICHKHHKQRLCRIIITWVQVCFVDVF